MSNSSANSLKYSRRTFRPLACMGAIRISWKEQSSYFIGRIIEQSPMLNHQFEYRVRVSPRSHNVRLRVTARNRLEAIVPRGYDTTSEPGLLHRKTSRICTSLEPDKANR